MSACASRDWMSSSYVVARVSIDDELVVDMYEVSGVSELVSASLMASFRLTGYIPRDGVEGKGIRGRLSDIFACIVRQLE